MGKVFNQEFKDRIVELHRGGGRTFMDIAKEFDLSPTTVANWVRAARRAEKQAERRRSKAPAAGTEQREPSPAAEPESDKARIVRLERELARKNKELEILGKALAFFARKMDR